jgi:hypothetical protein
MEMSSWDLMLDCHIVTSFGRIEPEYPLSSFSRDR